MADLAAISQAVREGVLRAARGLRPDARAALEAALSIEPSPRGRSVIEQLIANDDIARADSVPLCQDTGTVWVWLELGSEECPGGDLAAAIDAVVEDVFREEALRMSVVRDAFSDRTNTQTNTPAFVDVTLRPGRGATVHVMLKGAGSDNASAVMMLDPSVGRHGVKDAVVEAVLAKAASACPPLYIGVGVGSTFDGVAKLAKRALFARIGDAAPNDDAAWLSQAVLADVNASGIGPGGFGGRTTALGVSVITSASHIAALPVAVNVGCCAVRTASVEVA